MTKTILTTLILFCIFIGAKADPQIYQFTTTNANGITADGKLIISATLATTLYLNVGITRGTNPVTTDYENVTMNYSLYFKSIAGVEEVLGGPYNIVSGDFNGGLSVNKQTNISIGAGKIGSVYVKYSFTNVSGTLIGPKTSSMTFLTTISSLTSPTPPLDNAFNGRFFSLNGIYWCVLS